jgi:enolase
MKLNKLTEQYEINPAKEKIIHILNKLYNDEETLLTACNNLSGGFGDRISFRDAVKTFGVETLADGILVELEHSDNIIIALEIALDHLAESDKYYKYLEKMELKMKINDILDKIKDFMRSYNII